MKNLKFIQLETDFLGFKYKANILKEKNIHYCKFSSLIFIEFVLKLMMYNLSFRMDDNYGRSLLLMINMLKF